MNKKISIFGMILILIGGGIYYANNKYYVHHNIRKVERQVKDILHTPAKNNYKADIDQIAAALPDINRDDRDNAPLPTPNKGYLKTIDLLKEVNNDTRNRVSIYDVEELLHFNAHEAAKKQVDNHKRNNDKSVNNRIALANYYAIHGACEMADIYYKPFAESHPIITKALNLYSQPDDLEKEFRHRKAFFVLHAASTAFLCDSKENAVKIIETYTEYLQPEKRAEQKAFNQWQVKFRALAYSKLGIDLKAAEYEEQATEYISYAKNLSNVEDDQAKAISGLYVMKNLIYADMLDIAETYYPKDSHQWSMQSGIVASAYARHGNFDKVLELASFKRGTAKNRVHANSVNIIFEKKLSEQGKEEAIAFLEHALQTLKKPPYREANNLMALISIAHAYGGLEQRNAANEVLEYIDTSIDIDYKVIPYAEMLMRAYMVTDGKADRAYEIYQKHVKPMDRIFADWGYLLAVAKDSGDIQLAHALQKQADENPKISALKSTEVEYFLDIRDINKAKEFAQTLSVRDGKELTVRKIAASIRGDGNYLSADIKRYHHIF